MYDDATDLQTLNLYQDTIVRLLVSILYSLRSLQEPDIRLHPEPDESHLHLLIFILQEPPVQHCRSSTLSSPLSGQPFRAYSRLVGGMSQLSHESCI